MRNIRIGIPSGTPKLVMWEGTADEEAFTIKGLTTKPYIKAYGIKYELTEEEIELMHKMMKVTR